MVHPTEQSHLPVPAQEEPAPAAGQGRRIMAFDVIRGFFIMVMMTAHLLQNLEPRLREQSAMKVVLSLLLGTVGFVTVSGILIGYFFETRPGDKAAIVGRYRKTGIRLLLIAHPMIVLALYGWKTGLGDRASDFLLRSWFITDTLAVMFFAVVPLVARLRPGARLAVGVALLVGARLLFVFRPGGSTFVLLLTDILAGPDLHVHHVLNEDYPLLSLIGMFMIGSWIGRDFSDAHRARSEGSATWRYLRWAPLLVLIALDMLGLWAVLRRGPQGPLRAMFYPDYALSTYPLYVAAVLAMMGLLGYRSLRGPVSRFFVIFGRTSLFTYVVQYYVMQTLPFWLGWRRHMTLPIAIAYLIGAMVFLNLIARTYERLRSRRAAAPALLQRPMSG